MTDETIFAAALEKTSPTARIAYLNSACAGNPEQRAHIEGLLAAHAKVSGFLERPAAGSLDPTSVTSAFGDDGPVRPAENSLAFLGPSTRPDSLGRLGHYEVLELLGRGGFGIVLRAFDESLHRVVAVKVLSPEMAATSPARKRFLREARASAPIRHENVVQVHAIEEMPLPYIVMEFIPGRTLQDYIDNTGPLEPPDLVRIGVQIARGLAVAHELGLVHRDIKPANILLEGGIELRVKITDFGLARAVDDASMTASGTVAGTPMYMAPEQARGEKLDHRADLFSLGSVLYTMCTGHPPFRANSTLAVLKRVCDETPRPILELIPETPRWLCDIISKLHAKNPAERFQTAKEVAELLTRREMAPPLSESKAEPERKSIHADEPRPRSDRKLVLAACVLLLAVATAIGLHFATKGDKPVGSIAKKDDERKKDGTPLPVVLPADGLQAGSVWEGVATMSGVPDPYPGTLVVTERSGNTFRGVSSWSFPAGKGKTEVIAAEVEGRLTGNDLAFKDTKELKGPHFAEPTVFKATLTGDQIVGTWSRTKGPAGTIDLVRRTGDPVGDPPPAKDAFPGKLVFYDVFDDPKLRLSTTGDGPPRTVIRDGKYTTTIPDGKGIRRTYLVIPQEPADSSPAGAFGMRVRAEAGTFWLNFRQREQQDRAWWLLLNLDPDGRWQLTSRESRTVKGKREFSPAIATLADSGRAVPELAGQWVNVTGRWSEAEYELFLNGKRVAGGPVADPEGAVATVRPPGLQLGIRRDRDGPATLDLDYIAVWALTDSDRMAAEYVLSIGGTVRVNGNEKGNGIQAVAELPKEQFRLTHVVLSQTAVTDAGLSCFKNCKNLTFLNLYQTQVTDEGLKHFKDCTGLTSLILSVTKVTDVGLENFKVCKNLTSLNLHGTQIGDAGLQHFKDCKELTHLNVSSTKLTDAGLANFKGCKNLTELILSGTNTSDIGVGNFADSKKLTQLWVDVTRVGDVGLAHFKDCTDLTSLNISATTVTDTGLAQLNGCKNLTRLIVMCPQIGDAGVLPFKDCKSLTHIYLQTTKVSAAARETLSKALPQCKIE